MKRQPAAVAQHRQHCGNRFTILTRAGLGRSWRRENGQATRAAQSHQLIDGSDKDRLSYYPHDRSRFVQIVKPTLLAERAQTARLKAGVRNKLPLRSGIIGDAVATVAFSLCFGGGRVLFTPRRSGLAIGLPIAFSKNLTALLGLGLKDQLPQAPHGKAGFLDEIQQ